MSRTNIERTTNSLAPGRLKDGCSLVSGNRPKCPTIRRGPVGWNPFSTRAKSTMPKSLAKSSIVRTVRTRMPCRSASFSACALKPVVETATTKSKLNRARRVTSCSIQLAGAGRSLGRSRHSISQATLEDPRGPLMTMSSSATTSPVSGSWMRSRRSSVNPSSGRRVLSPRRVAPAVRRPGVPCRSLCLRAQHLTAPLRVLC